MAGLLPALFVPTAVAQSSTITPIFQFGAFYNLDLDFSPGQVMTMNGKVHVNGTFWMYPQASVTFNDTVEATVVVTNKDDPNDQQNLTSYTTPTYNFTANGGKPRSGAGRLDMPINNTNVEAILNLPPPGLGVPNDAGYMPSNQIYLYNECDLIISNSVSGTNGNSRYGTNLSVYFDDSYSQTLTLLTNDLLCTNGFIIITNGSGLGKTYTTNYITSRFYSFVTNVTFYDFREQDIVQAVQIDIAKFNIWLTNMATRGGVQVAGYPWNVQSFNDKGHGINSIYVYNSVSGNSTLPAVRLVNGYQMPSSANGGNFTAGLTIATPMPLYVLGNYNIQTNSGSSQSVNTTNTAWTWPAALMGDSITVLSSNWSDSYTSSTSLSSRSTLNTTINAACLEGIVPSTYTTKKQYSGGLENFLRLEESWSGSTLCYNGSIVVMFPSIYATNFWTGPSQISGYPAPYYAVPTRKWGFDANFQTQSKLPPLTPLIVNTNLPVIVTQPQNQTVVSGSNVTFNVSATGFGTLSYQWSFNATNIAGATNTSLTLANVQTNQAGNYAVLVTDAFGSILSSNAVLTVIALPPSIQAQPTNQTVFVNGTATFSVTATGSLPLCYQWSFNGTNLVGATNASLALTNVSTNNAASYLVVITNLCGSVTSSPAILTVVVPPSISIQPMNQTVVVGSNVTFSVTVAGTGPFVFLWQLNGTNLPNNIITTVAGNGTPGYSGDGGPATNAMLSSPDGVANDAIGNLYIADSGNNRIREVDTNGIITTIAGNGSPGFFGDGFAATYASLYSPASVTVDAAGNLYIADCGNNCIRKVDTNGIITTIAGNGSASYSGDGGAATNATFFGPTCVVVDTVGNLYIADWYNNRIRKVDTNGIITTMAGNGSASYSGDGGAATNASLSSPTSVAVDAVGNLYIADDNNNRIRKVDTNGIITTLAGNGSQGFLGDGGAATNASLSSPNSVAMDAVGNLYIAVHTNANYSCIRRVDTNGIIATVYFSLGEFCFLAVNAAGNLFIDDTTYQQTSLLTFTKPTLTLNNVSATNAGNYSVVIISPYGSVTSSNAVLSVYATAAATLNGCSFSCVNGIQFQVAGVPGFNYAMQSSTNLIDWVSLITNTSPFIFMDANATNFPQQFYRAIYVP